jgi:Fic family protein
MSHKPTLEELFKDAQKTQNFFRIRRDEGVSVLVNKAQARYLPWEKFRHQVVTGRFSIEEAWLSTVLKRQASGEVTPIKTVSGKFFNFGVTREQQKMLRVIDAQCSGNYIADVTLPDGQQKQRLQVSGLIEEAINSSQLEGASTTRQDAKEMIQSGRAPRTESESMVLNNFFAMERIEEWEKRDLDESFLFEVHAILTKNVLPENEQGAFRNDEDGIVVSDPVTGEIFHRAPSVSFVKEQLESLYRFANSSEQENDWHPFVKACMLHFWIGYLHPFTDGNGRTARIIFYWYLIKNDYWMFRYVSTSKIIKQSKKTYGKAYLLTEQADELDLGYFIQYILRTTLLSIEDFKKYLIRKRREEAETRESLYRKNLNDRQIELISTLSKHHGQIDIETYKKKFSLVYETARRDLLDLEEKRILRKRKEGKRYVYGLA